jgi:predicted RND superfamily exporter protein
VTELEARLGEVPRVSVLSALSLYRRVHPLGSPETHPDAFRAFATGTDLFRKQGLVGPDFLGLVLDLAVHDAGGRDAVLAEVDAALRPFDDSPAPLTSVRRIGGPYVDAYLEKETARASNRSFPLFGAFIVAIILGLYRSLRTLGAFLLTLLTAVALTVGAGYLAGFSFTIVSSLVPLTILITCTAALVYLQSRFTVRPAEVPVEEHQIFTLTNKFVATTASIIAAAIGFAALAVSRIRPIHDMGLWVALGLLLTWGVVFTLFPALQSILRTPSGSPPTLTGRRLERLFDALPRWSYRWRHALLASSFLLMIAGTLALTGIPGHLAPMALETDALDYINHDLPIYRDTRRFDLAISGLSVVQLWVTAGAGDMLQPEMLRGLEALARDLERDPRIGSVTGPTTLLRWSRYVGGGGDHLPEDPAAWPELATQLDQMLLQEPALRSFVDVTSLADARLTVIYRDRDFVNVAALKGFFAGRFQATADQVAGLRAARLRVVGQGLLETKIAEYLVPTLSQSFLLTAGIIFMAFLIVFKSGAGRIMAMIPSVFAILVMFLVMRLSAIPLNVATILIASTVLGASENDQIHFFYHFQEKRASGSTEQALRHALRIAGRAILFATLINAGGFLALALSDLPPMRQFGIIAASAFVLSMLASLTALPAALWVLLRQKPDGVGPSA